MVEVVNAQILLYEIDHLVPPTNISQLTKGGYLKERIKSVVPMAQAFRFAMDRRMQNKGYTLVEMLVVLSILSMLTLLFAFSYRSLKENTTYWSQSI